MCGRYTLHTKSDKLAKRFNLAKMPNIPANYNVAPGQIMPVIIQEENEPKLQLMKWGFIPVWAKDPKIGYKLINARDDGIFTKPMWRSVIKRKRAIIPADGFYEWKKSIDNSKTIKKPYYIKPKDQDIFGFAGIWEVWHDAEGKAWPSYTIITTSPNKEMKTIHDRMPVILHKEDEKEWLNPDNNDNQDLIEELLKPYKNGGLEMYEVSSEVNFTKNNEQKLIYPINSL